MRKYLMGAATGLGLGLLAGGLTGGIFILIYTPHGGGPIGDWTGIVVLAISPIFGTGCDLQRSNHLPMRGVIMRLPRVQRTCHGTTGYDTTPTPPSKIRATQ